MSEPPVSGFVFVKSTLIAETEVSAATEVGMGVGVPGMLASTNWSAGL